MCIFGVWLEEYAMTYVGDKSATMLVLPLTTHVTNRSLDGFSLSLLKSLNAER
jgi:hypothetical protein